MGYSFRGNAAITDIDGGLGTFRFQFIPGVLRDADQPQYATYGIIGRSTPLLGYEGGGPRTLDLKITMFARPVMDGPGKTVGEIDRDVKFLRALVRPDYASGLKPPHRCYVYVGSSVRMIGVCKSCVIEYPEKWPWEVGPGLIHGVEAMLQFAEVRKSPLDCYDVLGGAV